MKIIDPVLVPDVSLWVDHINSKEFEDGGCESVIVGLYFQTVNGKKVLMPVCRNQCTEVATHSSMVLQAYYWDDIILDPVTQANLVADCLVSEGLPIKWIWADDEQWWNNWTLYNLARRGFYPMSLVPKVSPTNISLHMQTYAQILSARFPQFGVYTNNGFVASWASSMNTWLPKYRSWIAEYVHEPSMVTAMTWEQLKANWLPNFDINLAAGQLPSLVAGLQFTGDRIKLPGSYDQYNQQMTLDVSVFSKAFIDVLRGGAVPTPIPVPVPVPIPTNEYFVNVGLVNVRSGPATTYSLVGTLALNTKVIVTNPTSTNGYLNIGLSKWVFGQYLTKVAN